MFLIVYKIHFIVCTSSSINMAMVSVFEMYNETCPLYVSLNCDLECADQFRLLIAKERK